MEARRDKALLRRLFQQSEQIPRHFVQTSDFLCKRHFLCKAHCIIEATSFGSYYTSYEGASRMRRLAILAEGAFEWHYGKTATGVIRYGKDTVVAVIDSTKAGMDVPQALGGASFGYGIPVVRDINEALNYQPDSLLIGIAPMGGALPEAWRWQLLTAIDAGLDIISGLHMFLSEDEKLRAAAAKRGVKIWDVRRPPDTNLVAQFIPHRPGSYTILMVGSDCAVGKMTVALELDREASNRGLNSAFVAPGQTGIIISGNGLPVDRIISDFVAGMVEEMVIDFTNKHDWVFVEGQGALY